jgi:LacI family transcriptional regulator
MARRRSTTLADVARLAGVSLGTASKALNKRPDVRAQTRERVEQAAEALGFSHNSIARGLSSGRSGTVGLLTSDLEGRFSLPILMGAEDAFGTGQLSVLLCDARGDAIREQRHLDSLLSRRIDGLIVVGSYTDARASLGSDLPVPVVYAYTPSASPEDRSITPDNVEGGRLAAAHLVETGRRRIGHITGQVENRATKDRAIGIHQAIDPSDARLVAQTTYGEWTERWGRSAASMILAEHPDVDALLCDSDQIARGALDAVLERRLRVPEDVAIIGFDNWSVLSAASTPGISSVDMNLESLGRRAAQLLFDAIDGEPLEAGVDTHGCRLVVRGSTIADR